MIGKASICWVFPFTGVIAGSGAPARVYTATMNMRTMVLVLLWSVAAVPLWGGNDDPETGERPIVRIRESNDGPEAERLIAATRALPPARRVVFLSGYLLGREYPQATKTRIKKQHAKPKSKTEATNAQPLPIEKFRTSLTQLDCMTYVEHVLALAACEEPMYAGCFLPRLIDVMCDAGGQALMNHHRSHFTSHWAEVNIRKGYLTDVARNHRAAVTRKVTLNRVGKNRTFYIEDRFMIADRPTAIHYFPTAAVALGQVPLQSGDVLALVCNKEGLDVLHMGFYIERAGKRLFRHASMSEGRIVEQELVPYLLGRKAAIGLMVLRPRLEAPTPPAYRFLAVP